MDEEVSEFKLYESHCEKILKIDCVRFAGIINQKGRKVAGGFNPSVTPYQKDNEKFRKFIERMIDISISTEDDVVLGRQNYVVSRRDKVVLISFPFPVSNHILLISAEPRTDIEILSEKVMNVFSDSPFPTQV